MRTKAERFVDELERLCSKYDMILDNEDGWIRITAASGVPAVHAYQSNREPGAWYIDFTEHSDDDPNAGNY